MQQTERRPLITGRFRTPLIILTSLVAIFWLLELIDVFLLDQRLNSFGLRPRTVAGLFGIALMPFLHGGLSHLTANTLPFLVLGGLVILRRMRDFFTVTLVTLLVTGLGLWLLGNGRTVYIGASGLVFGYFGFLLVRGYFDRNVQSIAIAIVVFLFYGGLLWGLVPHNHPGVSWAAHFLGFIGGAVAARMVANGSRRRPLRTTRPVSDDLEDQIRILT